MLQAPSARYTSIGCSISIGLHRYVFSLFDKMARQVEKPSSKEIASMKAQKPRYTAKTLHLQPNAYASLTDLLATAQNRRDPQLSRKIDSHETPPAITPLDGTAPPRTKPANTNRMPTLNPLMVLRRCFHCDCAQNFTHDQPDEGRPKQRRNKGEPRRCTQIFVEKIADVNPP